MPPVHQLSGFVERFTALTFFHVRVCKQGWEKPKKKAHEFEDKCNIEDKDD